jgi:hypothetical protein
VIIGTHTIRVISKTPDYEIGSEDAVEEYLPPYQKSNLPNYDSIVVVQVPSPESDS